MQQAEQGPEPPPASVDRGEDGEVGEGEREAETEMEPVADRLGAHAVGGERGTEQERDVHSRPAELACRAERRCQDDGADEAAGESSPYAHELSSA